MFAGFTFLSEAVFRLLCLRFDSHVLQQSFKKHILVFDVNTRTNNEMSTILMELPWNLISACILLILCVVMLAYSTWGHELLVFMTATDIQICNKCFAKRWVTIRYYSQPRLNLIRCWQIRCNSVADKRLKCRRNPEWEENILQCKYPPLFSST